MSKSSSNFPPWVKAYLWSYDPKDLDIVRDRQEIITQVLNYGTWNAVKWIRQTYSDDDLRGVLKQPARGRWFRQCLNFWLIQLNITLPPETFRRAIFEIRPQLS